MPRRRCLSGNNNRCDLFIEHHTGPLRNDYPTRRCVGVLRSGLSLSCARLHQDALGFPQGLARDRFRRRHRAHFLLRSAVETKLGIRADP